MMKKEKQKLPCFVSNNNNNSNSKSKNNSNSNNNKKKKKKKKKKKNIGNEILKQSCWQRMQREELNEEFNGESVITYAKKSKSFSNGVFMLKC